MKKDMPLEGLRWSRDSGSALYDTPQNGRSRTGWGGMFFSLNLQIYIIFSELANYWDIKNHNETKKAYKTHF